MDFANLKFESDKKMSLKEDLLSMNKHNSPPKSDRKNKSITGSPMTPVNLLMGSLNLDLPVDKINFAEKKNFLKWKNCEICDFEFGWKLSSNGPEKHWLF